MSLAGIPSLARNWIAYIEIERELRVCNDLQEAAGDRL
jgi:hypothetical protein